MYYSQVLVLLIISRRIWTTQLFLRVSNLVKENDDSKLKNRFLLSNRLKELESHIWKLIQNFRITCKKFKILIL